MPAAGCSTGTPLGMPRTSPTPPWVIAIGRLRYRTIWLTWLVLGVLASVAGAALLRSTAASIDGQAGVHAVIVIALWLLAIGVLTGVAGVASIIVWLAHRYSVEPSRDVSAMESEDQISDDRMKRCVSELRTSPKLQYVERPTTSDLLAMCKTLDANGKLQDDGSLK